MKEKRLPSQLEAVWKEKDLVDGKVADALVMIMRTSGLLLGEDWWLHHVWLSDCLIAGGDR